MVKLYDSGVYLLNGTKLVPETEAPAGMNKADAKKGTISYGILPAPKYEESQEGYRHTTTVFNGTTMMIPVSAADPEKVGFIQEAICYESYYSFLPAFYQNFLETKYARNQESIEMLQIIHNSIYYDMSGILVMDKIGQVINNIAGAGTGVDTIASKLSANEESANATMQKTIAAILEH